VILGSFCGSEENYFIWKQAQHVLLRDDTYFFIQLEILIGATQIVQFGS